MWRGVGVAVMVVVVLLLVVELAGKMTNEAGRA